MANVYAIASGNWSNTAIWNTGALPTAADDVFSNNFTVAVDQNITVLSLRNTAAAPIVAGGTFNFNTAGVTASITGATPLGQGSTTAVVSVTNATGLVTLTTNNSINFNYNVNFTTLISYTGNGNLTITTPVLYMNTFNSINGITLLNKTSTGTLTVNGNLGMAYNNSFSQITYNINSTGGNTIVNGNIINSGTLVSSAVNNIILQLGGNLTLTGDVTPPGVYNIATRTINFSGSTLTINGNLVTGVGQNVLSTGTNIITGDVNGTTNASGFGLSTSGVTTIIGNISGNTSVAISSSNTLTVTGNVTTTGTGAGISVSSATTLTITGDLTAGSSGNAVTMTNGNGILRLTGNLYNVNNRQAFNGFNIFVNASTPMQARFFTPGIIDRTLYSEDTFPNQPAGTNVRESITYGPGSGLIGTLAMPAAADVRSGVIYDSATTGTALFTTALLLSEINSSATPVAVRLRNTATPEILGTILASYKP